MPDKIFITVETVVNASAQTVWDAWTKPEHITKWNQASEDWHCPRATVDLKEGGKMSSRMEAKDGSAGFDFEVTFTKIVPKQKLEYMMTDGRTVSTTFEEKDGKTRVVETFVAEHENPVEMQRGGWQAILENFKNYAESQQS